MWVSKKKWHELERKVAALEKEQLSFSKFIQKNIESNETLIQIVKDLREDLNLL